MSSYIIEEFGGRHGGGGRGGRGGPRDGSLGGRGRGGFSGKRGSYHGGKYWGGGGGYYPYYSYPYSYPYYNYPYSYPYYNYPYYSYEVPVEARVEMPVDVPTVTQNPKTTKQTSVIQVGQESKDNTMTIVLIVVGSILFLTFLGFLYNLFRNKVQERRF
jgi:hypothetical protein